MITKKKKFMIEVSSILSHGIKRTKWTVLSEEEFDEIRAAVLRLPDSLNLIIFKELFS